MLYGIAYGLAEAQFDLAEESLVVRHGASRAVALADPVAAVRQALDQPFGFPPLGRALTPDDHVAIVIDERLPPLAAMLMPIVEHVRSAGVAASAITIVSANSAPTHAWLDQRPELIRDIAFEVHDPNERTHLSYLATTRHGRRVYLNRTVVDADQIVVLAQRGYDPVLGYAGTADMLFPALSDEATRKEFASRTNHVHSAKEPRHVLHEATEVSWLLGAPFLVQVIAGRGDEVAHVLGGVADSDAEGQRLLDSHWRLAVDELADTVVAAVSGDPKRQSFADLARALTAAFRVLKPNGRIVLLTQATPALGPALETLRTEEDAATALARIRQEAPPDLAEAVEWITAANKAHVYLLSGLESDVAEELLVTPLDHAGQAQRLLGDGKCLFLEDAHKTWTTVYKVSEVVP